MCVVIWAGVGMYLDKIMPREFGRAEPWNFLCKKKQVNLSQVNCEDEVHDPRLIKKGNF